MYRANHIASECYLARWADENGQVCVVEPPVIESSRRKPAKVAARRNFWGTDPEVRREAEETINRIETDAAVALRGLAKNWPLPPGSRDFLAIAFLIAVHLWRNPPGHDRFHSLQQRELERNLTEYTRGWNEAQIREFLTRISSDRFRAELMLADLFPAASLLGSMHWSLRVRRPSAFLWRA
jgi:hypothetical protein